MAKTERENIERIMEEFLPDKDIRRECLKRLCAAIQHAATLGSNKWGVGYERDRRKQIKLLVGSFIVFTIEKHRTGKTVLWLALDADRSLKENTVLNTDLSWKWDEEDGYPAYSKVPSRNGSCDPGEVSPETWQVIEECHFRFLDNVAQKYKALQKRSQYCHAPEVLGYLQTEAGCSLPEPMYDLDRKFG